MNKLPIIVFDTETTGLIAGHHEVIELCAQAYDPRSLEKIPEASGGLFYSRMKPLYPERADEAALRTNKFNLDDFVDEKHPKAVWPEFVRWVRRFNSSGKDYTAPICAGKNISFDLRFCDAYNELYSKKKKDTVLFNNRQKLDMEDPLFLWHENDAEMTSMKFDFVRDKYGIPKDGAHSARVDVEQEGFLIISFLKLHRQLVQKDVLRQFKEFVKNNFKKEAQS